MGGEDRGSVPITAELRKQRVDQASLDRFLSWLFLFAPARFTVKSLYNPWEMVPSAGLNTPTRCLIAHILQTPHPAPALWDLQAIHPDPGALDHLERRVDETLLGRTFSARLNRAMGNRPRQFEDLKELIPRVRKFDYPPQPEGTDKQFESLVEFLRYAGSL